MTPFSNSGNKYGHSISWACDKLTFVPLTHPPPLLTLISNCVSAFGVVGVCTYLVVLYLLAAANALFLINKRPKYKPHIQQTHIYDIGLYT